MFLCLIKHGKPSTKQMMIFLFKWKQSFEIRIVKKQQNKKKPAGPKRGGAGVAAGRPSWSKNCFFFALGFKCFLKFKDFRMWTVYPQKKLWDAKPGLNCAVVRQISWVESEKINKNGERKQLQSTVYRSGKHVLHDYVTIHNQRPPKILKKGRTEINFVLPLCLGNTARHLQLLHPSAEELNDTRGIG
jgi:hypothetical protein